MAADRAPGLRRVVLIGHDLGFGGAQRKIRDLALDLPAGEGGSVEAWLLLSEAPPASGRERRWFDEVAASPMRIHVRASGRRLRPPFALFCLWHVARLRPDRVVGFLRGPGILAVLIKWILWWRPTTVGISDDSFPSGALREQVPNRLKAAAVGRLMSRCYRAAEGVVAPSAAAKRDLVERFRVPADRVVVHRNWVDLPASSPGSPSAPSSASPPADSPAPARDPRYDLIFVGRLVPVKRVSLFLEVVAGVKAVVPGVRAAVVGSGPEGAALLRHRDRLGLGDAVEFTGARDDVGALLRASKIFCLTSEHEGLPIAGLEAMAHGRPVVSVDYPGADEWVDDGVTGYLRRDAGGLADCIVELLRDEPLRARLGRQARRHVEGAHGAEARRSFAAWTFGPPPNEG